jgi:hypothetical protein
VPATLSFKTAILWLKSLKAVFILRVVSGRRDIEAIFGN